MMLLVWIAASGGITETSKVSVNLRFRSNFHRRRSFTHLNRINLRKKPMNTFE